MNLKAKETASGDQTKKEASSEEAVSENQVKDTSLASLEELQNLAGGSDIKVHYCCFQNIIVYAYLGLFWFDF